MAKKEYSDLVKFKNKKMMSGETVITWGVGYIGEMMGTGKDRQYNGVLVVTNLRIVFYSKGLLSEVLEEISHDKVSSVFIKKILMHTTLTVHTSGNDLVFKSMVTDEVEDLKREIDKLKGASSKSAKSEPSASSDLDLLAKLAELHKSGVLSDEEFMSKKKEILAKVA